MTTVKQLFAILNNEEMFVSIKSPVSGLRHETTIELINKRNPELLELIVKSTRIEEVALYSESYARNLKLALIIEC